ncbi:WXG100 family type VII secretion target [Streptomyces violaceus]|uniref:WXG100 family type VII secretion target n=1 Tax=Streptomyces violaceus TaxID=1936 RepID=A0ABY9U6I5_STRVL|nr:WXG100 family type VII secretion target [Streptomyces janthinus]WND18482.1 WXG100 family type VII secretion target [Streptomyces janthinus]GGS77020.1 hypothetical protein GCM10010270_56190 [Streptomyces janthinus]
MTVTPGAEQSPYLNSPAARNGDLPQGLKSSPSIPNHDYPHLGFNPTPGDPDTVRDLSKKLANCARTLQETHELVTKLMDGSYWKGDAAVAFREQLDDVPPAQLEECRAFRTEGRAAARPLGGRT